VLLETMFERKKMNLSSFTAISSNCILVVMLLCLWPYWGIYLSIPLHVRVGYSFQKNDDLLWWLICFAYAVSWPLRFARLKSASMFALLSTGILCEPASCLAIDHRDSSVVYWHFFGTCSKIALCL